MSKESKFDGIDLSKVEKLAKLGLTNNDLAEFFDIGIATWYRWQNTHPEFKEMLDKWKAEADERVVRSLYERATGYSCPEDKIFNNNGEPMVVPTVKHYPPDTVAAIFWLKNRRPDEWRDKQEHDVNVKTVKIIDLTGEDADTDQDESAG